MNCTDLNTLRVAKLENHIQKRRYTWPTVGRYRGVRQNKSLLF